MTSIRLAEVLREAARNVAAGTTRALVALMAFVLVVGVVAVAQARGVAGVAQQAHAWRAQGSSIQIVPLTDGIDGAQCDALAGAPGITAAGAVRAAPSTRLAVLPSAPVQTFEATPGMARLLGVTATSEHTPGGVWLADDLAATLGDHTTLPVLLDDDTGGAGADAIPVAGIYPYPADGRTPTLAYSLLAPVPATGTFDACWIEVWPETDAATSVLMLPVNSPVLDDGQRETPQLQQLNASMGRAFDGPARLAALPTWPLTAAALALIAALGYTQIRTRRLELASALHAGVDKPSLLVQLQAETLAWTLPATLLIAPVAWAAAVWGNPDPAWIAFYPAARTIALAVAAAHLATLAAALAIREKHLFRHFKQR